MPHGMVRTHTHKNQIYKHMAESILYLNVVAVAMEMEMVKFQFREIRCDELHRIRRMN